MQNQVSIEKLQLYQQQLLEYSNSTNKVCVFECLDIGCCVMLSVTMKIAWSSVCCARARIAMVMIRPRSNQKNQN